MKHQSGRAIYIGKPRAAENGFQQDLSYGQTGFAVFDPSNKGKCDFRPDGLNIVHLVPPASVVVLR